MASKISDIESLSRLRLIETSASFWTSQELTDIIAAGIRDLWRDVVDLKQEHYLTINTTDVTFPASVNALAGVPADVHKVYNIEPSNISANSTNVGVQFRPLEYNNIEFQRARAQDAVQPTNCTFYYAVMGQGAPVSAPTIVVAPQSTQAVSIAFSYVPTLGVLTTNSFVPIPGEADDALVAWCVAFARAKEREDRSPDPNWLAIYATSKQHLMQSLGLRQYQEPEYCQAIFQDYWS